MNTLELLVKCRKLSREYGNDKENYERNRSRGSSSDTCREIRERTQAAEKQAWEELSRALLGK